MPKSLLLIGLFGFIFFHFFNTKGEGASSSKRTLTNFKGLLPRVRIKDISKFQGVRENQLVGYGLVVGLNNTGDTLNNSPYTKESLIAMLERLGVNTRDQVSSSKNVAAVMVTALLPAFIRQGASIDVNVSAIGDAKDLKGGTLLVTPLLAADGEVYAVAQGAVATTSIEATGQNISFSKGVPTSARIPNGGLVEKEVDFKINTLSSMKLSLNNPDFTTAERISLAINEAMGSGTAQALDCSTVLIKRLPQGFEQRIRFLASLEQLEVEPDQRARVIIDEHNGVITMGHHVRMDPIAVTHGNVTIRITETPQVNFPISEANTNIQIMNQIDSIKGHNENDHERRYMERLHAHQRQSLETEKWKQIKKHKETPDMVKQIEDTYEIKRAKLLEKQSQDIDTILELKKKREDLNNKVALSQNMFPSFDKEPIVTSQTKMSVSEEKGKFTILESGARLDEFVNALNLLGVSPRDMIAILQNIKAMGALHAELVTR